MECIVNVTEDWGIGLGDRLLVSLKPDLQRFRELTTGKTVLLGRKTLATFPGGRPLAGRRNLVLSTNPDLEIAGAEVFHSLPALLARCRQLAPEELMVIGGQQVYEQLLPYCARAQVTRTRLRPPADRFFPDLDALPGWRRTEAGPWQTWEGTAFRYETYVQDRPRPL